MPEVREVQVVERSGSGIGTGMVLGMVVVLLVAAIAIFMFMGGPGKLGGTSGQTNINVPAQVQPPGPNIEIPRQIDINVNQPAPVGGS